MDLRCAVGSPLLHWDDISSHRPEQDIKLLLLLWVVHSDPSWAGHETASQRVHYMDLLGAVVTAVVVTRRLRAKPLSLGCRHHHHHQD